MPRAPARALALALVLALSLAAAAAAQEVDVDEALAGRPQNPTTLDALDELVAVEHALEAELAASPNNADRVLRLERLLRIKDAQLADAQAVTAALDAHVAAAEKKVRGYRAVIERGRSTTADLSDRLRGQISEEDSLKVRLDAEQAEVTRLETTLKDVRRDADDPSLARWLERRVENFGALIDSEQSARELGSAVRVAVDGVRGSVEVLESSAAAVAVPPFLAMLLSVTVVVAPCVAVSVAAARVTNKFSSRQHVLVGHIGNSAFLAVCVASMLFTRHDPLVALHHSSPLHATLLMLFFCVQWPIMIGLLFCCLSDAKAPSERQGFASQLMLFLAVCTHAVRNSYDRILYSTETVSLWRSNFRNYVLYFVSTTAMLVLTVSAADERTGGLIADVRKFIDGDDGDDSLDKPVECKDL